MALVSTAADAVKSEFDEQMEALKTQANGTIANLLKDTGPSGKAPSPYLAFMKQVSDQLGTSIGVAEAAASGLKQLKVFSDDLKADPSLTITTSQAAEFEAIFSAKGTTLIEGNNFIEGMKALAEAEFISFAGGKAT